MHHTAHNAGAGSADRCPAAPHGAQHNPPSRHAAQVYCARDFEFITTMRRWMPPHRPPVFVDAGANIGAATLLLSHLSALQGHVFSIEASPENLEILTANTAPLGAAVTVLPKALVPHRLALAGHTLEFGGGKGDFWGFRVEHERAAPARDAPLAPPAVVHKVETTSLPLLRVRPPLSLSLCVRRKRGATVCARGGLHEVGLAGCAALMDTGAAPRALRAN